MKDIFKLTFLLIAALSISSCSLFTIEVDSELDGNLDVYVAEDMSKAASDWYPFEAEKEIDAWDNEDVKEYNENIKSVSVKEIAASIEWIDKGGVILSDDTYFWIVLKGTTDTVTWSPDGDWHVDETTKVYFSDLGDSFQKAADIIDHAVMNESESVFLIGVNGGSSVAGVNMEIKVSFLTTFEATIL